MRALIPAVVTVLSFLYLLCLAATAYGRALPLPDNIQTVNLDRCDGVPCILGIAPGKTNWDEAQAVLAQLNSSQPTASSLIVRLAPGGEAAIYKSINTRTVGRMYVTFRTPLPAGWIIDRLGTPCGVSVYPAADTVTLRYPSLLANLRLLDDRLTLYTPVASIHFRDPDFRFDMQPDLCVDNITSGGAFNALWKGFAPIGYYVAHAGPG